MVTAPSLGDLRNGQHPCDLLAGFHDWRADCGLAGGGLSRVVWVPCMVLARSAHVRATLPNGDAVCCNVILFRHIANDPTRLVGKPRRYNAAIQPPIRYTELDCHSHSL